MCELNCNELKLPNICFSNMFSCGFMVFALEFA